MSLALYASPYDNNGIDNSTDNLISKKRLAHHNKTQKYYNRDNNNSNNASNQSDKVKNIIKKIHDNSVYNDSIDGVEMGDFSPLSPPESAGVNRTIDKSNFKENYTGIGIEDGDDINMDNYNYNNKNNSVNALSSSNSNYYTIPSDNNSKLSMQQHQQQPLQRQLSSQPTQQPNQGNQPNASNYLDSIEYNNLNNNYGDSKTIEEYYKKFSPNYSYGAVSNWNRNAESQTQANMINKKIYANGNMDNSPFLPSLMSSSSTTNIENSILIFFF